MKSLSLITQILGIGFVIYFACFKPELSPKDIGIMIFWATLWITEEIKQTRWDLLDAINPPTEDDINNENN